MTALPGHAASPVGDSDCCLARVFCGLPPKELHPRCVQQIDVKQPSCLSIAFAPGDTSTRELNGHMKDLVILVENGYIYSLQATR